MSTQNQENQKGSPLLNRIFSIILLLAGSAVLVITYLLQTEATASQSWPSTDGEVVASFVEEYRDSEQELSYKPRVQYIYTVGGQLYKSQKVKIGLEQSYGFYNNANKELADYPLNATVTVYYDPAEPTNAVLDRSSSPWYIGYAIGAVLMLMSMRMLITAFKRPA